jgi:2-polyprenyl-3-methyl-5-hydroxy-6-metoxy-1,4-benzoquinol methylase
MNSERIRCPSAADGRCDFQTIGEFPDRSGCVGKVEVLRCRHCGIGISAPPISDVAFLYADRSSQDFQPGTRGLAHFIKKVVFHRLARALLAALPGRPARVIDFGCGSGLFTRCLGDELRNGEVIGVDFHGEPPHDLAGRPYRPMAEAGDLAGTADVVLAMHVLEHEDDASGLLRRITALARPGGRIVIEVPNIDCVWAKVLGAHWDNWYLPFHRSHFNKASLQALLAANGLVIEAVFDICVPTMGRTAANLLHRRNSLPFLLLGILLHPVQWLGEIISGRPSALRVIARK